MTNKAGEQPTITQADRDALADYYSIEGIGEYKNSVAERVRQGLHEDPLLDAFARHRTTSLAAPVDTLFDAIKHGDDAHKAWLKEAIECHFSGKPIPPARGKGTTSLAAQEPVAMRYDFDGYGWKYIDSGSGSDWQTRYPDAEPLYSSLAAQDEGLISDKSRIERLRRLVHRWITQGQVRGVVHDMDLQCEIDDAFAWANGNGISAPAPSLAAQDGLVEAAQNVLKWLQDPQMGTWTYVEGNYFYRDIDAHAKSLTAALSAIKGDKPIGQRLHPDNPHGKGGWE